MSFLLGYSSSGLISKSSRHNYFSSIFCLLLPCPSFGNFFTLSPTGHAKMSSQHVAPKCFNSGQRCGGDKRKARQQSSCAPLIRSSTMVAPTQWRSALPLPCACCVQCKSSISVPLSLVASKPIGNDRINVNMAEGKRAKTYQDLSLYFHLEWEEGYFCLF